jgi:dTDP-4-dehydrorhamnose 3,5-epimerase
VRVLVLGAGGQAGRALAAALPDALALSRAEFDIAAPPDLDWSSFDAVLNAAAYTDVDGAETPDGRVAAWRTNAIGPAVLARAAAAHGLTLVHLSSEYVFDGRADGPYAEDAPIAPLSVYGAAKAAGDLAVGGLERHYLVRPTWVVGDGRNFVRTMLGLAARGVSPTVVADQIGRPTFATDIAAAIVHLLESRAPYGTYHVTGGGGPASWADVARAVFTAAGHDPARVSDTTTAEYFAGRPGAAPRPLNSVLDCTKAAKAGVDLPDWHTRLPAYIRAAP